MKKPYTSPILGVNVSITNMEETVNLIVDNIDSLRGEYICLSNVHTTVMSDKSEEYRNVQNKAFMALPDGSPLSLVQRLRGFSTAEQVAGPDLMPALWKASTKANGQKLKHYFYGSSPETIEALRKNLSDKYPELEIVGLESPPFRPLSEEEDKVAIKRINDSGADILWVGLGAPKQEQWMYEHRGKINALMLGVGAGFDFHAGTVKRAPAWMRNHYLEWLYRLTQDPKRLFKRYLSTNIKFVFLSIKDAFVYKKNIVYDKKNLLIYAHYYYPDVASTGQILTELAEGLNDTFHTTVICTVPSYTGKIDSYYKKHKYYFENINGVDVLRIRVPEFRKSFPLSRIVNIVSYFFSAIIATRKVGKTDFVFAISQPPVLGGMLGVIGSRIRKAKFVYNIQDFNPEQIQAVNFTSNKLIINTMMRIDKNSCHKADRVVIVGRDMVETLKKRFENDKRGLPKFVHINNWINEEEIYPLPQDDERVLAFREKYGLTDKFVFMYSGNIGLYYDLPNILKTIHEMELSDDIAFAFVGEGSVLGELKKYVSDTDMKNVVFIPYQDKADLIYSLNAGDVHFVVNAKGIKGVSVPSKLYGVMAAGKPVFGILEKGSEAQLIIEESGCGISVCPGDYTGIKNLIKDFVTKNSNERTSTLVDMGKRGRQYLDENLSRDISIQKYESELMKL